MQLKLSDISPGDIIEHESWGCNHGGVQERLTRRRGKVIQVTDKVITLQGKNYPEMILVNGLLSGRAKILKITMIGEDTMARYDWNTLWPQVQELQAKGKSVTDIATELGIERNVLISKIYREENKQTPSPPEPDQAANQDPEREERGSAIKSIPEVKTEVNEEEFGNIANDSFTVEDEEPIPYMAVNEQLSPLASVGNQILVEAWKKITAVIDDPIALPLIKELIRQGVA